MNSPHRKHPQIPRTLAAFCLSITVLSAWAQDTRRAPVRVVIAEESPVRQSLALSGTVIAARSATLTALSLLGRAAPAAFGVGLTVEGIP